MMMIITIHNHYEHQWIGLKHVKPPRPLPRLARLQCSRSACGIGPEVSRTKTAPETATTWLGLTWERGKTEGGSVLFIVFLFFLAFNTEKIGLHG
jgi:hypothetical protein